MLEGFLNEEFNETRTHSFSSALPDLPFYILRFWRCPRLIQVTLFSILFLLKQVLAGDSHSPLVQRNASCSSNIHYLLVYLKEKKKSILAVIANRLKFFSSSHKLLLFLFSTYKKIKFKTGHFFRCIHSNRSTSKFILLYLHLLKSSCLSQNINGTENNEVFLISTPSHLYLF